MQIANNPPVTGPLTETQLKSGTGTITTVNSSTGDETILAANVNRKGAIIYNTDANTLYLLLAVGVASASNLSVPVPTNEFYEIPFGYTGVIKGTWAADGAGAAIVTQFT